VSKACPEAKGQTLREATPQNGEVLIAIRDPDLPDIDAADHLAIDYENIVEREGHA
jgi:hypothetical protein